MQLMRVGRVVIGLFSNSAGFISRSRRIIRAGLPHLGISLADAIIDHGGDNVGGEWIMEILWTKL
jgi:hypothetical protein